jgi:hypothetical protein
MGAIVVDRNIAFLSKRSRIKHVLTGPRVDRIRICRITLRLERANKCPVHQKIDCLDMYVKCEDAVNELANEVIGRAW